MLQVGWIKFGCGVFVRGLRKGEGEGGFVGVEGVGLVGGCVWIWMGCILIWRWGDVGYVWTCLRWSWSMLVE